MGSRYKKGITQEGLAKSLGISQYHISEVVLHAFQKKSKHGNETPKQDMDLIRERLRMAEELYKKQK